MNRIDRLTAIIIQLQSRQYVKTEDIAERFEISLRTVYRDLRALEEAGVAITPGIDFGEHRAAQHVRFAYTTSLEQLQLGVERIQTFINGL